MAVGPEAEAAILEEGRRMQQAGIALGLSAASEIDVAKLETGSSSAQALVLLKQLKSLPVGGEGSSVINFGALSKEIAVWVWEEGGVPVGSLAEHAGAEKINLTGSPKITRTPQGHFIVTHDGTQSEPIPANALYLALLSEAAVEVRGKIAGRQSPTGAPLRVLNTALAKGTKEHHDMELGATDIEATIAMQELGVIMREVALIRSAKEHASKKKELDATDEAFKTEDEVGGKLRAINTSIDEIRGGKETLTDLELEGIAELQDQKTPLEAKSKEAAILTSGLNRTSFQLEYDALKAKDPKIQGIVAAHAAVVAKTPPTPDALARYAKLVFASDIDRVQDTLSQELAKIQQKKATVGFVTDLSGNLHRKEKEIEDILDTIGKLDESSQDSMWHGTFVKMQNGELTREVTTIVQAALEDPENEEKAQKAVLIALEAAGYKSDAPPEVLGEKISRLLKSWGPAFLVVGIEKISKLLEEVDKKP